MKKFNLSLVTVLAMSTFAIAGGDIAPVEPVIEAPIVVEEVDNGEFYLGLGYGFFSENVTRDADNFDQTHDMSTVMFQAGYKYNEYIGVEGRYWLGATDLSGNNQDLTGAFSSWGLYLKPQYPVTEELSVYALVGYASTALDFDAGQGRDYLNTRSFSWGVGADYAINENISLFADWTRNGCTDEFTNNEVELATGNTEVTIGTINVGLTYTF